MYFIYLTTNLKTGKKYIGQHHGNPDDNYLGSGIILTKAILKDGKENFKRDILEFCEKENIDEREKYWIKYYNAVENEEFYNLAEGGQKGDGWQACKKYFENHPKEAKKFYDKNYQNLLKWQKNNPDKVQENINKMLEGSKKWREENFEKVQKQMEKVNKAKEKWQQEHPEEHQAEIKRWVKAGSDANSKKILCVTTGKIFPSLCEAARYYNIQQPNITKCLKGQRKSCGKDPETGEKLTWKLID